MFSPKIIELKNYYIVYHLLCFRTVASALNSLAAITVEDVLQGLFNITLPASHGAFYARWISILFGALSFALVFVVERLGGVLEVNIKF